MTPTEIIAVAAGIVVVAIAVVIMFLVKRRQKPIKTTEETQDEAQPPKLQRTFEPVAPPPAYQDLKSEKKPKLFLFAIFRLSPKHRLLRKRPKQTKQR